MRTLSIKTKVMTGSVVALASISVATLLSAQDASPVDSCTLVAGALADSNTRMCFAEPDTYKTTIFEIGLCTAEPAAPTAAVAADLSRCVPIFKSPQGQTVTVKKGVPTDLPRDMITPPTAGNYTHGYAMLSPSFQVSGVFNFQSERTPKYSGSGTGRGTKCWTKEGDVFSFATPRRDMPFDCGSTAPSNVGVINNKVNSFDGLSQLYQYERTDTDGKHKAYLLTSDLKLASSAGQDSLGDGVTGINRLMGIAPLPTAITGTSQTMDLSFAITKGAVIVPDSPQTSTGVRTLYGIYSGQPLLGMSVK